MFHLRLQKINVYLVKWMQVGFKEVIKRSLNSKMWQCVSAKDGGQMGLKILSEHINLRTSTGKKKLQQSNREILVSSSFCLVLF